MDVSINEELIKHIAEIARLKLTEEEIKEFTPQLKDVLIAFSKINELDTENVKISQHPIDLPRQEREDVITECLDHEQILNLSKHRSGDFFKGPKLQ